MSPDSSFPAEPRSGHYICSAPFWMDFGVSMCYLHMGEGTFLLLYLLHKGVKAIRPLVAKDASQRLKMPGKTPQSNGTVIGGNLQFSALSPPAAGARVALGTRGLEGLARAQGPACPGLYLPLVPPARLLCSGAAPCGARQCRSQRPWGSRGPALGQPQTRAAQGMWGTGQGTAGIGRTLSATGAMT